MSSMIYHKNKVYALLVKQLKISSILDLKIKWSKAHSWLSYFSWVSNLQEDVIKYLRERGIPNYANV